MNSYYTHIKDRAIYELKIEDKEILKGYIKELKECYYNSVGKIGSKYVHDYYCSYCYTDFKKILITRLFEFHFNYMCEGESYH